MITVKQYDRPTSKLITIAKFKLVGDVVKPEWKGGAVSFKEMILNDGVHTAAGTYTMADGQAFMDALKLAFSSSSSIFIEEK
jgi:hypothetical protein